MSVPILGIDHAMVAATDLEAARQQWVRLGFVTAPLGNHAGRATANYCIMFPDSYLELIGINEPQFLDPSGVGDRLAALGEGLHRIALGTADADAAKAALEAAGLHPVGPLDLARPQQDPPGMVRFRNLHLPPTDTAGLELFLCSHLTPELMRPAAWLAHLNGALALAAVTVLTDDPAATAAALAPLFGADAAAATLFGATIRTRRGRIHLTDRARFERLHPGAAPPDLPAPVGCAIEVTVAEIARTEAALGAGGIAWTRRGQRLRVAPADANGTQLEFVPR